MFLTSPFVGNQPRLAQAALPLGRLLREDVALVRLVAACTFPLPVMLKRFVAPLWVFIFGMALLAYFGVRIIVIDLPSNRPALSILPISASDVATRSSTACPSSGCAT